MKGGENVAQALKEYAYVEPINYLDTLHSNSQGWITRAEISDNYKQWHYKYLELLEQDFAGENVYISLNTFP